MHAEHNNSIPVPSINVLHYVYTSKYLISDLPAIDATMASKACRHHMADLDKAGLSILE